MPAGFTAETVELADGKGDERLGRTGAPEDRIAAQTWASAEAATLALGATKFGDGDGDFRVYADPAGHPFCLCLH